MLALRVKFNGSYMMALRVNFNGSYMMALRLIPRVGQNRIYTYIYPVYLVISKPSQKYRMYTVYVWFWPTLVIP
jgi:hypothetical protein